MEINHNKKTVIAGWHIMIAAGVISLLCCVYWLYRSVFCQDAQWLNVAMTGVVSLGLLYLSRKRKVSK